MTGGSSHECVQAGGELVTWQSSLHDEMADGIFYQRRIDNNMLTLIIQIDQSDDTS